MPHRLEPVAAQQPGDVGLAAGEVVVDAQHVMAIAHQPVAQMRAQEPGAPGHQDALSCHGHMVTVPYLALTACCTLTARDPNSTYPGARPAVKPGQCKATDQAEAEF